MTDPTEPKDVCEEEALESKRRCIYCTGYMRFQVAVFVDCDASLENKLSKKNIATKKCTVLGVGWPEANYYCTNSCINSRTPL